MLVQIPEEIVSVLSFIIFFTTWLVTQCCRRPDEHSPVLDIIPHGERGYNWSFSQSFPSYIQ